MNTPAEKFPVGGLKLSPELVQIRLHPEAGRSLTEIFRRLADHQINLTDGSLDITDGRPTGFCLISAEDRLSAEQVLQPFEGAFEMVWPVGTLTIFPHQSRLALMGRILSALGSIGLPVYGIASSLSSLIITTDYGRLDDAVSAVCRVVSLPENHAPFRPEFRVKQL